MRYKNFHRVIFLATILLGQVAAAQAAKPAVDVLDPTSVYYRGIKELPSPKPDFDMADLNGTWSFLVLGSETQIKEERPRDLYTYTFHGDSEGVVGTFSIPLGTNQGKQITRSGFFEVNPFLERDRTKGISGRTLFVNRNDIGLKTCRLLGQLLLTCIHQEIKGENFYSVYYNADRFLEIDKKIADKRSAAETNFLRVINAKFVAEKEAK